MGAAVPDSFRALVAEKGDDDVARELRELSADDLGEGDVVVRVDWSSVNYKDALAVSPKGKVAQISPLVPGVDLAGTVVSGENEGEAVIVHGHDLGVAHHGGFAEYARVPGDWVIPLPDGLSARQAMALGTAGFTAGLSVQRLEDHGVTPDDGPVLVLGASGGVGSTAVGILAARGFEVAAATGKPDEADWLRELGASEILSREETSEESKRPMEKERWAAVVDPVGGTLAGLRAADHALRRRRRGQRPHRRHLAGDDGLPLHPAHGLAARRRLRQHPDRSPARGVGAARERPAPERPRREHHARGLARRRRRAARRRAGRQGRRPHRRPRERLTAVPERPKPDLDQTREALRKHDEREGEDEEFEAERRRARRGRAEEPEPPE